MAVASLTESQKNLEDLPDASRTLLHLEILHKEVLLSCIIHIAFFYNILYYFTIFSMQRSTLGHQTYLLTSYFM